MERTMPTVRELLGVSAVSLLRYGIMPDDDVYVAVKVLEVKAPHLAKAPQGYPRQQQRLLTPPPGRKVVFYAEHV